MTFINQVQSALASSSPQPNLSEQVRQVVDAPSSPWDELFWAAQYMHTLDNTGGSSDERVMQTLDRALTGGLTYQQSPLLFLEASKLLAQLYFKYGKLRQANNYLLYLRDLSETDNLPPWVYNYSAKLYFKLDLVAAIDSPGGFFELLELSQAEEGPQPDIQRIAVIKEFLNSVADFLARQPIDSPRLSHFLEEIDTHLTAYGDDVTDEWARLLSIAVSNSKPVRAESGSLNGTQARRTLENRALQTLVELQGKEIVALEQRSAELANYIEHLGRETKELREQVRQLIQASSPQGVPLPQPVQASAPEFIAPVPIYREPLDDLRILVIGAAQIPAQVIYGIGKTVGLRKDQLDLQLDYEQNKRFRFDELRYNSPYAGILIGPIAHKVINLDDYSSIIQRLKHEEGFPPFEEIRTSGGHLKITKTSFKEALQRLITVIQANTPAA